MNSKCGVQSKRKHESHDSCVCIAGFSACVCQKKSVVYETECRHVAVQKAGPEPFIALKHSWILRRRIVSDGADFFGEVIRKDIREVVGVKR